MRKKPVKSIDKEENYVYYKQGVQDLLRSHENLTGPTLIYI